MSSSDLPVFAGVRMDQHAGVTAALAEGFELEAVLAQEQIEAATWQQADTAWAQALASGPDLQMAYMQKRREAEDALARSLDPVDSDPEAYSGLLAAIASSGDAAEVLGPLGLTMTDLGRLGRLWKKRAKESPETLKALQDAAGKAPAPTAVRAEPLALRPFPWSPPQPPGGSTGPAEGSRLVPAAGPTGDGAQGRRARLCARTGGRLVLETDPDLFAATIAVRQVSPEAIDKALTLCGSSTAQFEAIETAWDDRMAGDPDLRASVNMRVAEHRHNLRQLLGGARPVLREASR